MNAAWITLGQTDVNIPPLGIGTWQWGDRLMWGFGGAYKDDEVRAAFDAAMEAGLSFFDTAEVYGLGRSEKFLGSFISGNRGEVVIATKFFPFPWRLFKGQLLRTLRRSLKRLGVRQVDLYQLHWPERRTNFFGRLGYSPEPDDFTPFEETLEALAAEIEAGRIRAWGLSNETAWGTMRFIAAAERLGLPPPASVQNPYNLLNRSYEVGMAEVSWREHCGLLAYSPLGFGVLSGKYLDDARPPGARLTLFPDYTRYSNPQAVRATRRYVELARRYGLDPAQMALAYVNSRPFLTATIIGATTLEQLEANIASAWLTLDAEVLEGIEAIHVDQPNPAP